MNKKIKERSEVLWIYITINKLAHHALTCTVKWYFIFNTFGNNIFDLVHWCIVKKADNEVLVDIHDVLKDKTCHKLYMLDFEFLTVFFLFSNVYIVLIVLYFLSTLTNEKLCLIIWRLIPFLFSFCFIVKVIYSYCLFFIKMFSLKDTYIWNAYVLCSYIDNLKYRNNIISYSYFTMI